MGLRKIKSEKEIQVRNKRLQFVVGVVLIGLLVLASMGYFASERFRGDSETAQATRIQYGGKTYFRQNDLFILQIENRSFYFFNLPNESRGIYLNQSSFEDYSGKPLYIVNPQRGLDLILMNLEFVYSRWQTVCLEESCEKNLPLKDCSENLIVFVEDENTKVERRENCIFIYGNFEKGVDAFSYSLLGIK